MHRKCRHPSDKSRSGVMSFSGSMNKLAHSLPKKMGSSVTLNKVLQSPYNPITGDNGNTVAKSFEIYAGVENYTSAEIASGVYGLDDVKFTFNADEVITKQDTIQFEGNIYNIINIQAYKTQNVTVAYIVQARKR